MKKVRKHLFKRGSVYYYLSHVNGKQKWISLRTKDAKTARELADQIHAKTVMANAGFGERPRLQTAFRTVKQVLEFYSKADCPRRDGRKREGDTLRAERAWIENLSRVIGHLSPGSISGSDWENYVATRRKSFEEGRGLRTIDREFNVLQSAFRWAKRHSDKTGITADPLPERPVKLRRNAEVEHCRDFQPDSAEELHKLAAHFMPLPDHRMFTSTVFGWLTLLSAMIGQRCAEMVRLRSDGNNPSDPGFDDSDHLWLYRSKTHKGTASFIKIEPELRECLEAHAAWKRKLFPESPWFFPSPKKPERAVLPSSFSHALTRAAEELKIPKRTPHGLRSYFVNVLRSRGVTDSEIALRIGHKSQGRIIIETYGEILPIKLDWLPKGKPAWDAWKDAERISRPRFA